MAIQTISVDDVKALCAQGMAGDGQAFRKAEYLCSVLLNHDPDNWVLAFMMAGILLHTERHGQAIVMLRKIAQEQPKVSEVWNNLGTAYRRENHKEQAHECLRKALELRPEDADVWNNLGTLHINEGEANEAYQLLSRCVEIQPWHRHGHWNLALAQLELEHWRDGFANYRWGLSTNDRMAKRYGTAQWWRGDKCKSLAWYGEQGIGDEVMFASIVPDIMRDVENVILDCHPRLETLFKRSFPRAAVYPTRKLFAKEETWVKEWIDKLGRIEYKVAAGDAPAFYRHDEADFPKKPYLVLDRDKVEKAKAHLRSLGEGAPILMAHVGGHKKTRKDLRTVPLVNWLPVFGAFKDCMFVSCDYTNRDAEYAALKEQHGVDVHLLPEVFESSRWERWYLTKEGVRAHDQDGNVLEFTDKADAKRALEAVGGGAELEHTHGPGYDLDDPLSYFMAATELGGGVVTVNNSWVHMCGAIGARCVTLTPQKCAWRYGSEREDMVWYGPHIKQARQKGEGWDDAMRRVIDLVCEWFSEERMRRMA